MLENEIDRLIKPHYTVIDAGCGRAAPVLSKYKGRAQRLIGIDLVEFTETNTGLELFNWDLSKLDLPNQSVDLIYSRSVMEHIERPLDVYREAARVLRPGGRFIFLTANKWDYASLVATVVPNSWHPAIVRRTEGRDEADTFPTRYKTNTKRAVLRFARESRLEIDFFRYLGQYPNYFIFNGALFLLGTVYQKTIERVSFLRWLQGWIFVSLRKP